MAFVEPAVAVAQDELTASAVATCRLGTRAVTRDGRVFRYCQAGAVALEAGLVVQSAPPVAGHQDIASLTGAVGVTNVVLPAVATGGLANLYAEGYVALTANIAGGFLHPIVWHAPISTTVPWNLTLETPLQTANPTNVSLIAHPLKGVVVKAATETAPIVGVATCVIPAGQYGWLLTWGLAAIRTTNGWAVNQVVVGNTSVGEVDGWSAGGGAVVQQNIGIGAVASVGGRKGLVFVKLGA